MADRVPAECFPVGAFLKEEMKVRGWNAADVAVRMAEGFKERREWQLAVELLLECSDTQGLVIAGETAEALGRAFGTSTEYWINLHASYQRCIAARQQSSQRGGQ